ncbi:2-amino-4-hydroxy-6-hydroxymethyldihydropteridine diphosphokinase [Promicromonospora thailandica]|uniref:Bifunctional folate synthesis protein n=1 Tax=Promicromonospora thailandica TaxID=765201 RepID=A0A9X2JXE2_9MICO|nr:2-amino-4-hydroxy-6-hydroxymethyldihydropteridine diphosphokinase [Promicromonospora thailandica]MCP2266462.1 dihydroneopterin aldolase/2-amino-4-hydroxy-6-hydroxymethyldihydropteridine diphosphokinase,TIGR01498 [Promicromonospora thailandica]
MTTAFGTGVTGPDGRSLDQVRLTGVNARGYHGVLPSERRTGQDFQADVVLYLDTRPAAAGDDLARTVSYADVARDVHDVLAGEAADLVETVAERIAAAVLARPQIEAVDVRVHKPQAPIPVPFTDVEVAIRRDRTHVPVVAAPATASAVEPVVAQAEAQDFRTEAAAEPLSYEPYVGDLAPQELEPAEPARRADVFEAAAQPEAPEPMPVPELIAPEPVQVVPAAWDLQSEPAPAEQRDLPKEPVFPAEELRSEPVQQYESLQGLDQRPDQHQDQHQGQLPSREPRQEQPAFEQQYDQFAQQPEPQQGQPFEPQAQFDQGQQFEQSQQFDQGQQFDQAQQFEQNQSFDQAQQFEQSQQFEQNQQFDQSQQFEQPQQPQQAQQFEQPQQFEQAAFEQGGYEQPPRQTDPQANHYDQLFDQQYDQSDMERTRVAAAVPDSAVGQPEQYPAAEQFQPAQAPAEEYREEPRDRFDEVPAGYVDVVIAIGANLGDPQATMRSAVAELDRVPGLQITDVSPLARTAAVGGPEEQPDYLNAVLLARTTLSARGLLHACQEIENVHGRTREERWGPRTLDVDLITYGTLTDSADDIEVPHPRAHERAFVLEPWSQIAPDAVLPGLGGGPVAQLAATAPDRTGIRWLALDWLTDPEPEQGAAAAEPADDGGRTVQDAPAAELPPALPPSVPPSGRPPVSPGGPVVEVPGGGSQPQAYPSGPTPGPGGSVPIPPQQAAAPRTAAPAGMPGSAVPPPEEALVPAPAPLAPRAVRDTAHEAPEHEPLPQQAKPVFAPVNPSRQPGSGFPPAGNGAAQEQAAPVFAPVGTPPNGLPDAGPAGGAPHGHQNGQQHGQNGQNGHPTAYDSDHTVIRVPGFVGEQRSVAPADGPIDSVPSWAPVRDERGRDA